MTSSILSKNTTKIYVTMVIIAAVLALLFFLLVMPLARNVRETRAKILTNRAKIAVLSAQIGQFKETEAKLNMIKRSSENIKDLFPLREDSVVLVEAVEDALARSGVMEASISITDEKETEGKSSNAKDSFIKGLNKIEEVPYDLTMTGTYQDYVNFLLYMESLPYITEITEINLTGVRDKTKSDLADGRIRALFFLKKP